jgi:hypothetical protein
MQQGMQQPPSTDKEGLRISIDEGSKDRRSPKVWGGRPVEFVQARSGNSMIGRK